MQNLIVLLGLAALTGGCASMASLPSTFGSLSSASLEIHDQTEVKLTEGNFTGMKTNVVADLMGFTPNTATILLPRPAPDASPPEGDK